MVEAVSSQIAAKGHVIMLCFDEPARINQRESTCLTNLRKSVLKSPAQVKPLNLAYDSLQE